MGTCISHANNITEINSGDTILPESRSAVKYQQVQSEDQYKTDEGIVLPESVKQAIAKLEPFVNDMKYEYDFLNSQDMPAQKFKTGEIYEGQWLNDQRCGFGKQLWPDGRYYEGYWRNDLPNLKGRYVNEDGEVYVHNLIYYEDGHIEDGKAQGKGKHYFANGVIFEGEWFMNQQHGYGKEIWPGGEQFQGNYENGHKEGRGEFSWTNGASYEGQFSNDLMEGVGIFVWPDKKIYKGQWQNNKMHGYGEMTWPDGTIYIGEFKEGFRDGHGELRKPDGRVIKGIWKHGSESETKGTHIGGNPDFQQQ